MVKDWQNKDKVELRKWLFGLLRDGEVVITFEKKDGTIREMKCTLKDVPTYEKKTETVRAVNEQVISVYDLDKGEWRSFRIDSIKQINFNIG